MWYSQTPVAHTYNPNYIGGRDQEDHSSKPAQANSSQDPFSKNPITRKGWCGGARCRPWVEVPVPQKRKENMVYLHYRVYSSIKKNKHHFQENE
jgi:hypothetical protein